MPPLDCPPIPEVPRIVAPFVPAATPLAPAAGEPDSGAPDTPAVPFPAVLELALLMLPAVLELGLLMLPAVLVLVDAALPGSEAPWPLVIAACSCVLTQCPLLSVVPNGQAASSHARISEDANDHPSTNRACR